MAHAQRLVAAVLLVLLSVVVLLLALTVMRSSSRIVHGRGPGMSRSADSDGAAVGWAGMPNGPGAAELAPRGDGGGANAASGCFVATENAPRAERPAVRFFIAIGTSPRNHALRAAARVTWLSSPEIAAANATYRFFTDADAASDLRAGLAAERAAAGDVVAYAVQSGYAWFAQRAFCQFEWALQHYAFDYFLRVDDDGYLCTRQVVATLASAPPARFFLGKYFCMEGRVMADENFMLFSRDVIAFFALAQPMLKMGVRRTTFAGLFGMWQHLLKLEIVDARDRIDAQQHYTTEFMHTKQGAVNASHAQLAGFCEHHLYAHHVKMPEVMHAVYRAAGNTTAGPHPVGMQVAVPTVPSPPSICHGKQFTVLLDPQTMSLKGADFPRLTVSSAYKFTTVTEPAANATG